MQAWESPIIRITSGQVNNVNDTVIGGSSGISGYSKFAGQLGKTVFFSAEQIAQVTKTSIGTLYGGAYQYVRRRADDDDSPALGPGKIAFWDTTATNWQAAFQVTTDTNLSSTANAIMRAGIFLNNIEPGNYGFIQWLGEVYIRFRAVLTTGGAIGSPVYAADVSDVGNDQGTADVITTDATSVVNERWMGWALEAPVGAALKRVLLASDAFIRIG